MSSLARALDRVVGRIETASALDRPADFLSSLARRVLPDGVVRDSASGTAIGHPLHPALVAVPIGAWMGAGYLDVAGSEESRGSAQSLVGLGVLAAVPTALTGISDWLDTEGAERRVGVAHWALNYTGVTLYAGSWLARRRGHHAAGIGLAFAGAGLISVAGWLGGHLAYALGVGVDTTAFSSLPGEWTDVTSAQDLPLGLPVRWTVDGVAVLLVRTGSEIVAMADRCTHRGAPLDEGSIEDGCIVCPWHGSAFDLHDGSVRRGPATRPQPILEVRTVDGRVEVRRTEERALRLNPVGP